MLSILIPTYNYDVTTLAENLIKQAQYAKCPYEIIIFDDASKSNFQVKNKRLKNYHSINYEELANNTGRAKIRNLLAGTAKYEYLLFIDCDSKIPDNNYLARYTQSLQQNSIIYGGRIYQKEIPPEEYQLHWKYGIKREAIPRQERIKNPNKSFMTNNFIISKSIFDKIRFDEDISLYGHEDTLFGYELKKNNIEIKHINNPLIHDGLETADDFIKKVKESVENLYYLMVNNKIEKGMTPDITLLKWYNRIKKTGLTSYLAGYYFKHQSSIIHKIKNNLSLRQLDILKLSYFCYLSLNRKK